MVAAGISRAIIMQLFKTVSAQLSLILVTPLSNSDFKHRRFLFSLLINNS